LARIPDDELARLKAEVPLEALAAAAGVELAARGSDLVGLCPFHPDTDPSLVVTPGKNLWHCFGACAAGGSPIDWVMRAEGVSFRHAVELLRAQLGVTPATPVRAAKTKGPRSPRSPFARDVEDAVLLGQVVGFYHDTLKQSPEALAYLEQRGLGSGEAVERFRLGFANRTLGYLLPERNRKEGAELRGRLQRLGILRQSGHEHFTGSLVVPVLDETGAVVEVYGRKIRDDLRPGTPTHLYLPGPQRGVWNLEALAMCDEVIVAESLLDALSFWCAGFRNVTAAYGTEGFGDDHHAAIERHGVARVLIAYDRDPAGDRAAVALAEKLMARGVECFRVLFPAGCDANDVARSAASATDALGRLIRAAAWMGKGTGPATRRLADSLLDLDPELPAATAAKQEPADGPDGAGASSFAADEPLAADARGDVDEPDDSDGVLVSPVPRPAPDAPEAQVAGDELRLVVGERRWRVRGLARVSSFDLLRLNVLVAKEGARRGEGFHVDTLDLYSARARATFVKQAAGELGVGEEIVRRDLGRVLLACEAAADELVTAAQAPSPAEEAVVLTEAEATAALELLRDPNLVDRIVEAFAAVGVVGEETNALVAYLAAVSRKLPDPLAVVVRSSSAAGKSSLLEAALGFVPEEDRVAFSAMTGQSLYYLGESDLAHRVLAIAEEEGAARAAYALKLLQSEGRLSIASTGKDPASGRLVTHTYRVQGPVAILTTTTAVDVDDELLNRCVVLTVDEGRTQTRAIHDAQRRAQTLDGLLARRDRDAVIKVHQDAQRLLRPLLVAIPFADRLTFADDRTRTRRDHVKYLALIRAVALLHQHQREQRTVEHHGEKVTFIEATAGDIALANKLAAVVLGRSLDELAPQTRRLLETLDAMVTGRARVEGVNRDQVRFTRREVREHTGWGDTQLKVHLARLVDLEHVLAHRGERGHGAWCYELLWDGAGRDGTPFLAGLLDPATLGYDSDRSGPNGDRSGAGRGVVGPRSAGGRPDPQASKPQANAHTDVIELAEPGERVDGSGSNGRVVVTGGAR
jgi:DNA primase catalytic core